tara:strand:+ start:2298 stop:2651 length:354 start_codon:yes stop_codon:yes gene_type:complete
MSQNMIGRAVEYRVKAGSRATIYINILDSAGVLKSLADTSLYASATWKVWKPDGTLIINGACTFSDRASGEIAYALSATDTAVANAGNWEGEVEIKNSSSVMTEQSKTFNFIIEESY